VNENPRFPARVCPFFANTTVFCCCCCFYYPPKYEDLCPHQDIRNNILDAGRYSGRAGSCWHGRVVVGVGGASINYIDSWLAHPDDDDDDDEGNPHTETIDCSDHHIIYTVLSQTLLETELNLSFFLRITTTPYRPTLRKKRRLSQRFPSHPIQKQTQENGPVKEDNPVGSCTSFYFVSGGWGRRAQYVDIFHLRDKTNAIPTHTNIHHLACVASICA